MVPMSIPDTSGCSEGPAGPESRVSQGGAAAWSASPTISAALQRHRGARFYRCALQVNPFEYCQSYRGGGHGLDEDAYNAALIAKCLELGIEVLGVTDHNHVGHIAAIRDQARAHGIHVFPGFEASATEGIHVLCLYPPGSDSRLLERYLGELGIRDTGPSASLSSKSLSELLRCVWEQGGVTIAAHVTAQGGLLGSGPRGQARIQLWTDPNLLAVQIPGRVDDVPQEWLTILRNRNPDYRREPGAGSDLALAIVNSKDVARPEDLEDPGASCWIKMSEVSIEGLRQAFLDPVSRIRLGSDAEPDEHAELEAIAWQGGFLDGVALHLNPNLNVLIGGRGAGKSTVIESLRYVLGFDPTGDEARKSHEGILRQVLGSGTKVSLLVRSCRPSVRQYLIERTIPNPPVVRDESGTVLPFSPRDVIPGVEIFGQHEISELTRSPEKLTRLLERFVRQDSVLVRRKEEVKRELERARVSLLNIQREIQQIEERLTSLPALEEALKRFQQAGLEERLGEQSLLVKEERVLRTASERLAFRRQTAEQLRRDLPIDRTFLSPKALEGLPGREILAGADAVLERLSGDLVAIASAADEAVEKAQRGLATVQADWNVRQAGVQASYEKILRELQRSRIDGEEFIRLRKQIEDLRPLKEREALLQRSEKELEERRRNLLVEWEDLKAEEFRQLKSAAKRVSRQLANRVQVEVTFAGNREPLFRLLRDQVGGRLTEAVDSLRRQDSLSLTELANACRAGRESLAQKFSFSASQAERIAQAPPVVMLEIEELDLPSTTTIRLNVSPEGQPPSWQSLDDLSTGQKATAVLLLLLLESDAPLVVDQPEDDLDNRFISEGIVPKMREEKRCRQFVFSTHNANIPVLGDAELIIGLTPTGEARAEVREEHLGSIDARPVR